VLRQLNGDTRRGIDCHLHLAIGDDGVRVQPAQPAQRREPPLLLAPRRHAKVRRIERLPLVQP